MTRILGQAAEQSQKNSRLFESLVVYMSKRGIMRAPTYLDETKGDYDDAGNSRNATDELLLLPML
jgi:hypothetical protein